jgi:hypothetical protein
MTMPFWSDWPGGRTMVNDSGIRLDLNNPIFQDALFSS